MLHWQPHEIHGESTIPEPRMGDTELLSAIKRHYPNSIQKGWVITQPKTLQVAVSFLSDIEALDLDEPPWNDNATHQFPGPHVDNYTSRNYPRQEDEWGRVAPQVQQFQTYSRQNSQDRWNNHHQTFRNNYSYHESRGRSPENHNPSNLTPLSPDPNSILPLSCITQLSRATKLRQTTPTPFRKISIRHHSGCHSVYWQERLRQHYQD